MKKDTIIELSVEDMAYAAYVGGLRRASSLHKNFKDAHGLDIVGLTDEEKKERQRLLEHKWYIDILGASAECAFANGAGLHWRRGCDDGKLVPDVDPDWQVRSTPTENYSLIIRKDDPVHFKYALMVGKERYFRFAGWVTGEKGRELGSYSSKGNGREEVWWVAQRDLWDLT